MTFNLTKAQVLETEKQLLAQTFNGPFLVINNINGDAVEAIFSKMDDANKYILRESINMSMDTYQEELAYYFDQKKTDQSEFPSFADDVKANFGSYYEIHNIHHLGFDLTKPIYMIQSGNNRVYGKPGSYLTHSIDVFKKKSKETFGEKNCSDRWIEQCIVKVNPCPCDHDFRNIDIDNDHENLIL